MVVLKRLSQAVADEDLIYAVIRGSAWNNDGAGKVGYTAPSAAGQADAIALAQAAAGVTPDTIAFVDHEIYGDDRGTVDVIDKKGNRKGAEAQRRRLRERAPGSSAPLRLCGSTSLSSLVQGKKQGTEKWWSGNCSSEREEKGNWVARTKAGR